MASVHNDDFHSIGSRTRTRKTSSVTGGGNRSGDNGSDTGSGFKSQTSNNIFGGSVTSGSSRFTRGGDGSGTGVQASFFRALGGTLTIFRPSVHSTMLNVINSATILLFITQALSIPLVPLGGPPQSSWWYIIIEVLSVLRTFASNMAPLWVHIRIIPVIIIFHAMTYGIIGLTWRFYSWGRINNAAKLATLARWMCWLHFLMALPAVYFCTAFINCDYMTNTIIRYPQDPTTGANICWDFKTNFTGVLGIFGVILPFSQAFLAGFWALISVNTDPSHRAALFAMDTPYTFVLDSVFCILGVFVYEILPGNTIVAFPPVRNGLMIVLMGFHVFITRAAVPFYKQFVNSSYFGSICARVTLPAAFLVLETAYANQTFSDFVYYIAYPVVAVASIAIGALVGASIMTIQQAIARKRARLFVKMATANPYAKVEHHDEHGNHDHDHDESSSHDKSFLNGDKSKKQKEVNADASIAASMAAGTDTMTVGLEESLDKVGLSSALGEMAVRLMLGRQGTDQELEIMLNAFTATSKKSCGITVMQAAFFVYKHNSGQYGYMLLRKALSHQNPGILQMIKIFYLLNTIEVQFVEFSKERTLSKQLKSVMGTQYSLLILYKQLWKAVSEEKGAAARKKVDALMDMLHLHRTQADEKWAKIFRANPRNATVLRAFADFQEEVDSDPDGAAISREEAELIEQETRAALKTKNAKAGANKVSLIAPANIPETTSVGTAGTGGTGVTTGGLHIGLHFGKNRVHPSPRTEDAPVKRESSNSLHSTGSHHANNAVDKIETEDDLPEDAAAAAEEDGQGLNASRASLLRQAIWVKKPRYSMTGIAISSLFFALLSLSLLYVLVTVTQSYVTMTRYEAASCDVQDTVYESLRMLRAIELDNAVGFIPGTDHDEFSRVTFLSLNKSMVRLSSFLNNFQQDIGAHAIMIEPNVMLRIPITRLVINLDKIYTVKMNSLVDSLNAYSGSVAAIWNRAHNVSMSNGGTLNSSLIYTFEGKNSIALQQYYDNSFMYLNAFMLSDKLNAACIAAIDGFTSSAGNVLPVFGVLWAAILLFQFVLLLVYVVTILAISRERKDIIHMFLHSIPKDVSSSMFRQTDAVLTSASKALHVQIEELPQFAKLKTPRRNIFLLYKPLGLFIMIILMEIVFFIVAIVTFIQTYQLGVSKANIFAQAAQIKSRMAFASLLSQEYFFNTDSVLFSLVGNYNSSWQDMKTDTWSVLNDLEEAKKFTRYGEGGNSGMMQSGIPEVVQMLQYGSCYKSNVSLTAMSNLGIDGDITPIYQTCVQSMSSTLFSAQADLVAAIDGYRGYFDNPADSSRSSLKSKMSNVFFSSTKLGEMMDYINSKFMTANNNTISTVIIVLFVVFLILVTLVWIYFFLSFKVLLVRDHATRLALSWLSADAVEQDRALNMYILQHQLARTSRKQLQLDEDGKTRSILQACADGVAIISSSGSVIEVNRATLNMLQKSFAEVVGLQFVDLVAGDSRVKVEQLVRYLLSTGNAIRGNSVTSSTSGSTSSTGTDSARDHLLKDRKEQHAADDMMDDSMNHKTELEINCLRKDGSMFPAKLSMSIGSLNGKIMLAVFIKDATLEQKQKELLRREMDNSEQLLLNVLPRKIAQRLKSGELNIADRYEDVSVLFSDMCGFTAMSGGLTPQELIVMLNTIVTGFDILSRQYHLEKIKTIGDAFFAVSGLSAQLDKVDTVHGDRFAKMSHAEQACRMAIGMMRVLKEYNASRPKNIPEIRIRVGINSGAITGGVIGKFKYMFDCFGDTVNVASRMESTSIPGKIQLSRETYSRVYDLFKFQEKTDVFVKGKGDVTTYILNHENEPEFLRAPSATPMSPNEPSLMAASQSDLGFASPATPMQSDVEL